MKPIAVNSLFRWIDSLIGQKNFRVPDRTGNLPQRIGIAERIDRSIAETGAKAAGILKIPCYFPCSQGIRTKANGPRGSGGIPCVDNMISI
jgi:hypothetical protein